MKSLIPTTIIKIANISDTGIKKSLAFIKFAIHVIPLATLPVKSPFMLGITVLKKPFKALKKPTITFVIMPP